MFRKVEADPRESIQQEYFCPQWLSDSCELNTFFWKNGIIKDSVFKRKKIRNILISVKDKLLDKNKGKNGVAK